MNITNVLHRGRTGGVEAARTARSRPIAPPSVAPPSITPPVVYSLERGTGGGGNRRTTGGVLLVALLAITAVLGVVGTAVGFASGGDDGATERELRGQVAILSTARDDATAKLERLDGELASLRQQLVDAQDGADGLAGRAAALEARIDELAGERDEAQASVDVLETELRDTRQQLTETQQRLADVTADRDSFARLFPVPYDASLDGVDVADLAGVYEVDASRVSCTGLAACGAAPAVSDLTITATPEGYLRANIPGLVEGGLFRADGALHLVADSTVAVPACAGLTRTAGVTMTIFPASGAIGRDGAAELTALHAVITVEAPAVGTCPAALAFTSAELTARA